MFSISDYVSEIKLLKGNHTDTGRTGQGCFMNVAAYLNGDDQITAESECVCRVIRPIAIVVNDIANDEQRQLLVPMLLRAMGSTTTDLNELVRRAWLAVDFSNSCKDIAVKNATKCAKNTVLTAMYAQHAAKNAKNSARFAKNEAERSGVAAFYAAEYAEFSAKYAKYFSEYGNSDDFKSEIFEAGLKFLDEALPKTTALTPTALIAVEEKMHKLIQIAHLVV